MLRVARGMCPLLACLAALATGPPAASAGDPFQEATAAHGISGAWFHDGTQTDHSAVRGGGAAVLDFDGDGDEDLYVTHNSDRPNQLYRNDGGTFVDVAPAAGVASTARSLAALAADLDDDGDPELLVLTDGANILYRNQGTGVFLDDTDDSQLTSGDSKDCYGAAVADYDLDGDLDIYLSNWHVSNPVLSANELWRNEGGLVFVDVTAQAFVGDDRETLVAIWQDFDLDGDPDLLSVNEFDPDRMFENDGDGTFSLVTYDWLAPMSNVDAGLGMGVDVADVDLDGLQDIYVCNYWKNNLFLNDGDGTWTDVAEARGCSGPPPVSRLGWGVEMLDVELDGDMDIYVVNGHYVDGTQNDLYLNEGTGHFTEAPNGGGATEEAVSRGVVAADFDLDGDQDLFVVNHDTPQEPGVNRYYENVTASANHWLRVRTRGIVSNAEGVGARVTVTAGATSWVREVKLGSSYASSTSPYLTFGLGSASSVDLLTVEWPSGVVDQIANVDVDQTAVVVEGQGSLVDVATSPAIGPGPRLALTQNPTRGAARVGVHLDETDHARLDIYGADGRLVREIFSGRLGAGTHRFTWDRRSSAGHAAPPGVYYLRLTTRDAATTRRLVVVE